MIIVRPLSNFEHPEGYIKVFKPERLEAVPNWQADFLAMKKLVERVGVVPPMTEINWERVCLHDDHTYLWMDTETFSSPRFRRGGGLLHLMNWLLMEHGYPPDVTETMILYMYIQATSLVERG
jgi:hypothetical protein